MEKEIKTIEVFCATEQIETPHVIDIDGNGEVILTCTTQHGVDENEKPILCGRFLKFPAGTTAETLKELLATHKKVNEGQVSVEGIEKEKEALIEGLTETEA